MRRAPRSGRGRAASASRRARRSARHAGEEVLVAGEHHAALGVEHVDHREIVAAADLEVVEVVRRRDLDRARALLGIGVVVGDDGDAAADQRQDDVACRSDPCSARRRVHGDAGVAEHGLGPRGGDDVMAAGLALDRIADVPQMALDLDLLHLEVGDRGEQLRVPVDQPLVLVDQAFLVELTNTLSTARDRPSSMVKRSRRPVAGRAEALELVEDRAAGFLLPGPDALDEGLAAQVAAVSLPAASWRSTTIWVAMPAWSVPGCHSTSRPRMRSKRPGCPGACC
jgi:hypothetical protein